MIKIKMQIILDEGETMECPCCGKMHEIKAEDLAVLVGECEQCDMGIILEIDTIDKGNLQ